MDLASLKESDLDFLIQGEKAPDIETNTGGLLWFFFRKMIPILFSIMSFSLSHLLNICIWRRFDYYTRNDFYDLSELRILKYSLLTGSGSGGYSDHVFRRAATEIFQESVEEIKYTTLKNQVRPSW